MALEKTQVTESKLEQIPREFNEDPFVNKSDPRRFEIQRADYIDAAKLLAIAAFSMGGLSKEEAEKIVKDYENMYSARADFENPESNQVRFYHELSHPLVQMLSSEAGDILLEIHDKLKNQEENKAYDVAKSAMIKNPKIALEVRNKLRHDLAQVNGTTWQKNALNVLKNGSWKLQDLVEGKPEGYTKELIDAGFDGSDAMNKAVNLAARQFFPDGKGEYDKQKSFDGFNKGGPEFISAIYAYYTEFQKKKRTDIAEQIQMNIFIFGTIPFDANSEVFNQLPEQHLTSLNDEEKRELASFLKRDSRFQEECSQYKIFPEDQVLYWLNKKTSEACFGANDDVINFAKNPESIYYGDISYRNELVLKTGQNVLDLPPQERSKHIIAMIKEHEEGGFLMNNAKNGAMYHSFSSPKWPHLNCLNKDLVKEMHDRYQKNAQEVVITHQINLIQAALEHIFGADKVLDPSSLNKAQIKKIADQAKNYFELKNKQEEPLSSIKLGIEILNNCKVSEIDDSKKKDIVGKNIVANYFGKDAKSQNHKNQETQEKPETDIKPKLWFSLMPEEIKAKGDSQR